MFARWLVYRVRPVPVVGGGFDVIVSVWRVERTSGALDIMLQLTDDLTTPWAWSCGKEAARDGSISLRVGSSTGSGRRT